MVCGIKFVNIFDQNEQNELKNYYNNYLYQYDYISEEEKKDIFLNYYEEDEDIIAKYNKYKEETESGEILEYEQWLEVSIISDEDINRKYKEMAEYIDDNNRYVEYYIYYQICKELGIEVNGKIYNFNEYLVQNLRDENIFKKVIDLKNDISNEIPRDDVGNDIVDYVPDEEGGISHKYEAGDVITEDVKQVAIWLRDGKSYGDGISDNIYEITPSMYPTLYDMAVKFLNECQQYEDFDNKLLEEDENAIQAKNTTNQEDIKVSVDTTDKDTAYLKIGPLSVSYVEGIYNGVTFGGISNMYLQGYNADGELVPVNLVEGKPYDIPVDYFLLGKEGEKSIVPDYFTPAIENKSYVDYSAQGYPRSGETFYIKIKDPNAELEDDNKIKTVRIKVEFEWMRAKATVCYLEGKYDKLETASCSHVSHCHGHTDSEGNSYSCGGCCFDCYYTYHIVETGPQQEAIDAWGTRYLYHHEIELTNPDEPPKLDISMELGGRVWQDDKSTKETIADGIYNENYQSSSEPSNENPMDIPLPNVKVTLYEYDEDTGESKVAKLMVPKDKSKIEEDARFYINPTITDDKGEYLFKGIDSTRKYYVIFEYNGQVYLPTEYLVYGKNGDSFQQYKSVQEAVDQGNYNTDNWANSSKGTELFSDDDVIGLSRDSYDKQFEEIGSNPKNYVSTNSLKIDEHLTVDGGKYYNESFTKIELMGYTLNSEGKYEYNASNQLMDGYKYTEDGLLTTEYSIGRVTQEIKEYIEKEKLYPDENAMNAIYKEIAGGDKTIWRKLQFIEDCKINAYTGSPLQKGAFDLYPAFDVFVISDEGRILDKKSETPIYPGQYHINLGLWRRQEFDAALRKDIYKATLKINDKTVIYNYDKRNENNADKEGTNSENGDDNNTYWDINLRMSDYEKYYSSSYNEDGKPGYYREIYETDYVFNNVSGFGDGHNGDPLEIYITYKITVRNQSQSIMTEIKEVVDFYDKDYTYKPNLSWVMYQEGDNTNTSVDKNSYYEMMDQEQEVINDENTSAITFIKNAKGAKVAKDAKVDLENSKYGTVTHSDIAKENGKYQDLYVRGLENKKLATGESAYIYLTFQVNKENNKVILDGGKYATSDTPKENLTEINGYKTYYADNTKLPNGVNKTSENIAGLLDRDSNPGNLEAKDLEGDKYEKNFEDDTDRAPSLRVLIDEDAVRNANGIVWEDERNKEVDDSIIGDGIRAEGEIGVKGVTVQLVEKCNNGTEYIWYETTTVDDGKYGFDKEHLGDGYIGYIPGDYVIRFYYGDKQETAMSGEYGGLNETAYNGQDFKSTLYQTGINQEEATDIDGRYKGYVDTKNQNESVKYNAENGTGKDKVDAFVYDIYASDDAKENYSDAKDIWSRRNTVINYSAENVTNHKAEVLASPYSGDSSLYEELIENTYMIAETGMIVVEFEYDRQETDGIKDTVNDSSNSSQDYIGSDNEQEDNRRNSRYTLNNIDFGLVERPKAQLEIDKSVANVKVTLANGSILFDINKAANNAIWKDHEEYSIDEGKKSNGMYKEYYGEDHRYAYRTVRNGIDDIVANTDKGLIQLTMDEELMHGATIQIEYTIKITNVGEIDYVDDDTKDFYYNGENSGITIVTTTTNQVIDYVQNNLQFANSAEGINDINTKYVAETNKENGWEFIDDSKLTGNTDVNIDLVNNRLAEKLPKFYTIIQTGNFAEKALVPDDGSDKEESTITKTLILTQMITPENESDDLTYDNMVEIVKTSNTVGRRMAYSVVGNQDPLANEPAEVDTSMAEKIVILPPFGEVRMYYILGAIIAILLIGGIVLIKKKVLKGKD